MKEHLKGKQVKIIYGFDGQERMVYKIKGMFLGYNREIAIVEMQTKEVIYIPMRKILHIKEIS